MLKLLIFFTILVFGNTSELDGFNGDWTVVEFWPKELSAEGKCYTFKIRGTNDVSKCKGVNIPLLHMEFERVDLPAIVVDTPEEITEAVNAECEDYQTHYVLRRLNDNYFVLEVVEKADRITALLAKKIPSETELKDFVSNVDGLKNRQGSIVCTKEMQRLSSSRGSVNSLADLLPIKRLVPKQ